MEERGFYFTTKKNNSYYYDDINGNVTFNEHKIHNNFVFGNSKVENFNLDEKELQKYLIGNSGSQLILLVTESCNIRCEYCVYSGSYSNQRTHNIGYMNNQVAKKAVKKYLHNYKFRKYKFPLEYPLIGFYGGEPLLNFNLIKDIVHYSKDIYENPIMFSITTNATLLNEERIHFLATNQFILSISLNGNKEEHDRLRVFGDGTGTYEIIIKNLKKIKSLYPEYYDDYCQLLVTVDSGTDLHQMREFFLINSDILPKIARISQVGASFTNWYERYSSEEKNRFLETLVELREIYTQQLLHREIESIEPFLNILFNVSFFRILNRSRNIPAEARKSHLMPYTGACIPGDKIAVDFKGKLHVCERINQSRPIGDVENWFNVKGISNMVNDYISKITKKCANCPIQNLCEFCYPGVVDENGEFDFNNMVPNCHQMRKDTQQEFKYIWNLIENGVNINKLLPELNK
ncbi:radical SAM protein [Salipaludibacillus sp. HK11]|uniref:radical SAM protein n=1 Tax=Salipaludibacillus sp. HK11 TaxID=3394320 RepID=UPI0039FBE8AF